MICLNNDNIFLHQRKQSRGVQSLLRDREVCFTESQQNWQNKYHDNDVIMSAMVSQITSLTIAYSTVYSGADQRRHQISMAFVRGIHRWPVIHLPPGTGSSSVCYFQNGNCSTGVCFCKIIGRICFALTASWLSLIKIRLSRSRIHAKRCGLVSTYPAFETVIERLTPSLPLSQ